MPTDTCVNNAIIRLSNNQENCGKNNCQQLIINQNLLTTKGSPVRHGNKYISHKDSEGGGQDQQSGVKV